MSIIYIACSSVNKCSSGISNVVNYQVLAGSVVQIVLNCSAKILAQNKDQRMVDVNNLNHILKPKRAVYSGKRMDYMDR